MPRKLNLAALLGLITVSVLSFSLTAGAQSDEDGATDEVAEVQETLEQMRIDQERAAEGYNNARSTLEGLNGDITRTTQDLEATENRLSEAEANLSSQAEEIYKQGNVGFADILLDSEDASDFVTRLDLMARILITEQEQVQELRAARDQLAAEAEKRAQQVQNYEETTAEMESRWDNASALEAEMEAYLGSLNEDILAEIQAEQDRQAEAAAEEARSLLAAQARLVAEQVAAEESAAERLKAQQAAEEEAARQAKAAKEAEEALRQAQTQQEQEEAQAAAQEAQAAAAEAEQKAREEASLAAEAEQAKERAIQAAADEQAKKQAIRSAADQQAALMAEEAAAQRDAEADAAKQAIAAEKAKKAAEAAESEQERQQALAQAQEAEKQAREQAKNAEQAQQAKDAAQKALAEEQQKTQPVGTQLVPPPPPGAAGTQPAPNQAAATPPPAAGGPAAADAVAEGMKWMGVPYVLGGEDPSGMDCTGFVKWAYRGTKNLPHSIDGQAASGTQIPVDQAQAGDILIWPGYHVALVTGPGMMAHASNYHMQVVHVPQSDMEPAAYAVRPA